jgi:hypothetical protein
MKTCNKCSIELIIGETICENNWKNRKYNCDTCQRKIEIERDRKKREFVAQYKLDAGCETCGYNESSVALQLAHRSMDLKSPALRASGGKAYNPGWSIKRIEEEFLKCRVLCANCHAVETAQELGHIIYTKPKGE